MNRRWLVLAAFCCTFIAASNAQASDFVKGKVFDSARRPIVGARIFTLPGTQVACTNTQGEYRLSGYPAEWLRENLTVFAHLPDGKVFGVNVILDGNGRDVDFLSTSEADFRVTWSGCQPSRQILPANPMWVTGSILGPDGQPIGGATVRRTGFAGVNTDKYGHYTLRQSMLGPAGAIRLQVSRAGYQLASGDVITAPGEIRWFDTRLIRNAARRPSWK